MKKIILLSTTIYNILFSSPDSFAIKREHFTSDEEYTSLAADPRFNAVGFVSIHSLKGLSSCSAVLIDPKLILTAAHCFGDDFKTGFFSLRQSGESDLRDASEIEAVIMNPRYVGTGIIRNDIGFGVLKTPIYDIEPMVISADNPQELVNQTLIAVGYGESGDGSAREDKQQDKKKRATWVKISRYEEPYARLEADFLFPKEKSPLPYGSISKGDSGGALIAIKPDNSIHLVGITSHMRFEIKSLPQSPEKMIMEGLDTLPPRLKSRAEVQGMRNLIMSDYFENVGYGIVSNWMTTSDFHNPFLLPFNPIKNVEAIRSGDWSSSQTWSGVSIGQNPNNTGSENKKIPTYFNAEILKTVTLDKSATVEKAKITRPDAKLIIPTGTSLQTQMVTIEQGEVKVEGEIIAYKITSNPQTILSGSGMVRILPHTSHNGLHLGGHILGTNYNTPFIIDGPTYFKPESGIDAFIKDDANTQIQLRENVSLSESFSVNLIFSNMTDLEAGQSWTILTAPKIEADMGKIRVKTNMQEQLFRTRQSIKFELTNTSYEQTLNAKVFALS